MGRRRPMPADLVARYTAGATARDLATQIGCAVATVLRYLHERGATLRPRGGQRGPRKGLR